MARDKSTQRERRRSPIHTTILLMFDESDMTVADLREYVARLDGLADSYPVGLCFTEDWNTPIGLEVVR